MPDLQQRPWRDHVRLLCALAGVIVLVVVSIVIVVATGGSDTASSAQSAAPTLAAATSTTAKPAPKPTPSGPQKPAAARVQKVQQAVDALIAGQPPGAISVAAANTVTGATYSAGEDGGMWTASVYKLVVLETMLLQHQQAGTHLTDSEDDRATRMMEYSDNDAGYSLYKSIGGRQGVADGLAAFGMKHSAHDKSQPALTTLSAGDATILLRNLVSSNSPLDSESRAYALDLMTKVSADQRWGVGAVADKGTVFANKNGWLSIDNANGPGENDNGLWVTNSVGIVTIKGQKVLMAVLVRHQPNMTNGVNLVERLAKTIAAAVVA